MRIRQVRPEFWSDDKVGKLPDAVRLFYIGLWNLADDAGWFEWAPAQVGALLYPYRSPARREVDICAWMVRLGAIDRVRLYDCDCAEVPRLRDHQRVSGVPSTRVRDRHTEDHKDAKQVPLIAKQKALSGPDKQSPLSDSPVEVGRGRGDVEEGYTEPSATPARGLGLLRPRRLVDPVGKPA